MQMRTAALRQEVPGQLCLGVNGTDQAVSEGPVIGGCLPLAIAGPAHGVNEPGAYLVRRMRRRCVESEDRIVTAPFDDLHAIQRTVGDAAQRNIEDGDAAGATAVREMRRS